MLSNFFEIFLLLSPVFFLIILGNILRRIRVPDISFWDVNDKLVYWVLAPSLLFHFISQINFSSEMLYSYAAVILSGIFFVTTEPAPTVILLEILTGSMVAFDPMVTLFPIVVRLKFFEFLFIFPDFAKSFTNIAP